MVKNKCSCGCGKDIVVKKHHRWYGISRYICGHNININPIHIFKRKNHNYKERIKVKCLFCSKEKEVLPCETKRKFCSIQCVGKYHTGDNNSAKRPEVREKLRRFAKKRIEKYGSPMLGRKHTEAAKKKIGEKTKLRVGDKSPNYGKHTWNYGLTKENDKRIKRISEKISETRKRLFKEGKLKVHKDIKKNLRKMHKTMRLRWQDKEFRNAQIKKWIRGNRQKPNKKEQFLDNLIQSNFPKQFRLNVKGYKVINGKIPDWIDYNGQKKVILHNGLYWHLYKLQKKNPGLTKEQVEEKEKEFYEKEEFKVLHIWEDELDNVDRLKRKIKKFINLRPKRIY